MVLKFETRTGLTFFIATFNKGFNDTDQDLVFETEPSPDV